MHQRLGKPATNLGKDGRNESTVRPHYHFYNVDTGELTDIPLDAVDVAVGAALPPGTTQEGVDVVIRVRDTGPG